MRIVVRMATFTGYLRALSDDDLVALLMLRPDLAAPAPAGLSSLAARATSRSSLERALAGVDAAVLQVLEAVVALEPDGAPTPDAVTAAIAGPDASTGEPPDQVVVRLALDDAVARALLRPDAGRLHAAPGLAEVLGPHPAGLAAPRRTARRDEGPGRPDDRRPHTPARDLAAVAVPPDGHAPRDARPHDLRAGDVPPRGVLPDDIPAGARSVLEALTWGPPVGALPSAGSSAARPVAWLVTRGLLERDAPGRVVLPRAVALTLRQGRTHRGVARPPDLADAPVRPARVVDAESVAAAERVVRLVARLIESWGQAPPAVLRAGGLGVRDLRRLSRDLETDDAEATFVAELAVAAGLAVDDGEEHPSFVPTDEADAWLRRDEPTRWAALAVAWLAGPRAPWLAGTRDDRGAARSTLSPDLYRRWVPRLRAAVLAVLAGAPEGAAPDADLVLEVLRWRAPRAVPPAAAVTALLDEAGRVGVLGAGALSRAGAELLRPDSDALRVGAALAAAMPEPVDRLVLQADLTGVVPGRPSPQLLALMERAAQVESRGGAVTVRFTPESVRAALDAGTGADELLAALTRHATGEVPQPLEYLVRDAARRHGRLRVGAASSYLRTDDPALLAGLPDDPRLARLGLVVLAPTVLAAAVPAAELLEALRSRGMSPVLEGPDGFVVRTDAPARRATPRAVEHARRAAAALTAQGPADGWLSALVTRLRADDADAEHAAGGAANPSHVGHLSEVGSAVHVGAGLADSRGPAGSVGLAGQVGLTGTAAGAPPAPDEPGLPLVGTTPGAPAAEAGVTQLGAGATADGAGDGDGGTADPADALVLLREAVATRTELWVEIVGPRGTTDRRLLRPVRLEGGRLRAVDAAREAELTVAVHRIASVSRQVPVLELPDLLDLPDLLPRLQGDPT